MFSRISVALARLDAVTLDDLVSVIRNAYNPITPIACSVENIYDVKSWLLQYVATSNTTQTHTHLGLYLTEKERWRCHTDLGQSQIERSGFRKRANLHHYSTASTAKKTFSTET